MTRDGDGEGEGEHEDEGDAEASSPSRGLVEAEGSGVRVTPAVGAGEACADVHSSLPQRPASSSAPAAIAAARVIQYRLGRATEAPSPCRVRVRVGDLP
jgi:hypothetical protein